MLPDSIINKISTIISGVFLLLLAVSGNFIAETLGCQTQKVLQNNMLVKHVVTIFVCFFAINFASNLKDEIISPHTLLLYTLVVYAHFIIFTKCTFVFKSIIFALLFITYLSLNYIGYLKSLNSNNKESNYLNVINVLKNTNILLYGIMLINLLIGHFKYYKKQRKDHHKNWSYWIFLFGKINCASHKK